MAIITISRGTLSGGESLARCLSERLNLPVLSREVIRDAASRYGIAADLLSHQMEKTPTVIQRRMVGGEERRLYLIALQAVLAERVQEGDFIYHGHAGHLLLQTLPAVLRVRLIAPLEYRIGIVRESQGLNEEDAKKYIAHVDKCRTQWTRLLYNVEWNDPSLYDLVINLGAVGLETACALIDFTVRTPDFQESPEKKEIRADFLLASRIRLKLAQNDRTRGMQVGVQVSGHTARISGKFLSSGPMSKGLQRSEADVMDVIRGFQEIKKVEFDLRDAGMPVEA
jgi:cytidylate kinase